MNDQPIIIVGFMGSGKTSVARELSELLQVPCVDLDASITEEQRRSPEDIIAQDGELEFRQIESSTLRRVLASIQAGVISAGGGAWTIPENRKLIVEHSARVVWLNTPFEVCWKRISQAEYVRPMAPTREDAEKLYADREPLYGLADFEITVSHEDTPKQVAQKITAVLG